MKPVLQLFDQIMALKGFRQVTVVTSFWAPALDRFRQASAHSAHVALVHTLHYNTYAYGKAI
jgi:hypothetical protein